MLAFQVISNDIFPTATVKLRRGSEVFRESAVGDGPINALYSAIRTIFNEDIVLKEYKISSLSRGMEALGRVSIRIALGDRLFSARATDTDIIKASALALVNAINRIVMERAHEGPDKKPGC